MQRRREFARARRGELYQGNGWLEGSGGYCRRVGIPGTTREVVRGRDEPWIGLVHSEMAVEVWK